MMNLGSKIKNLRSLCGLTQEELADRCELTKGYISQLENDLNSPSISTLTDILSALGTNLKEFFNDSDDEQIKFTKEDYFVKTTDDYIMTWLVPNSQKNEMEPLLFELEIDSETEIDYPHDGEEFGYVIDGKIMIIYGNRKEICSKGDTFYLTTNKNHYIKNIGKKKARIIWVSSPPNF